MWLEFFMRKSRKIFLITFIILFFALPMPLGRQWAGGDPELAIDGIAWALFGGLQFLYLSYSELILSKFPGYAYPSHFDDIHFSTFVIHIASSTVLAFTITFITAKIVQMRHKNSRFPLSRE